MKRRRTFISEKYCSMLLGGSITAIAAVAVLMVDMLVSGVTLGEAAVAGINCVIPVYSIASFFSMVFSLGVPILYSRALGSFDRDRADHVFGTGLFLTLTAGAALLLFLLIGGDAYLAFFHPEPLVYAYAADYMVWLRWAIFLMPVNSLMVGMVFADGGEVISTVANLLEGIGKPVLSILLCHLYGTAGLGMASLLSLGASSLIVMLHFLSRGHSLKLNLYCSGRLLLEILRYSIVDACSYLFLGLFTIILTAYVSVRFGPSMMIMVSVIVLMREMQIVFDGIGEAITPIISMYIGEKNDSGIRNVWRMASRTAWIESIAATVLLLLLAPFLANVLGIEDPQVRSTAIRGIRIMSLSLIFVCRMFLDTSYYILVDRISLGVQVSALRDILISVLLMIPGCSLGGINGLFLSLAAAPVLGYALSVLYVRTRYGKESYPLFLKEVLHGDGMVLFEFDVTPDSIIRTRDEIERTLKKAKCPPKTVLRTMLLFEELFMVVYEKNPGKTVLAECSLRPGRRVHMVTKDNGILFDPTDSDLPVESLRSYVLATVMERYKSSKTHILTLKFNRNAFDVTEMEID